MYTAGKERAPLSVEGLSIFTPQYTIYTTIYKHLFSSQYSHIGQEAKRRRRTVASRSHISVFSEPSYKAVEHSKADAFQNHHTIFFLAGRDRVYEIRLKTTTNNHHVFFLDIIYIIALSHMMWHDDIYATIFPIPKPKKKSACESQRI